MRAGLLREEITVQRAQVSRNDYGEQDTRFTDLYTCRARVIHTGGNRSQQDREVWNPQSVQFIIRRYHDITPLDRVKYRDRVYLIDALDVDQYARQNITITASLLNQ